jgi:hypothetical protein
LPSAAVPNVKQGDTLVIPAGTFKVAAVEPDGTGVTHLALELQ